jgi:putative hydrolase of the HAD superfamily
MDDAAVDVRPIPPRRYEIVMLDVGGTLVGPSVSFGAVYAEAAATLGVDLDPKRLERSIRQVWAEMDRAVPRGANRYAHFPGGEDEYWLRFAGATLERSSPGPLPPGFAASALERIREAFLDPSSWTVFPEVRDALSRLRVDGARLAVVSNWDSRLPDVLERLDLARCFDEVGVSCFEGVEKPDPRIFSRVLARMGGTPSAALHVGDIAEIDVLGANAAGVTGLLVDRRQPALRAPGALPDLGPLPAIARGEIGWPQPA